MSYLQGLLDEQRVPAVAENQLRALREELESVLRGNWKTGDPRFYYGGSFGKRTMIRESYDLDLVVYFPPKTLYSVKHFFLAVEKRLAGNYHTLRHNVAVRLPYEGGLHVDVVPGRAIAADYRYANLYVSEKDSTKQTSIKVHIQQVRDGGNQDVIKLLKLWRLRTGAPIGSFALELSVDCALRGCRKTSLEDRTWQVLLFLRDRFAAARLVDPANSNNIISEEIGTGEKRLVGQIAASSCGSGDWRKIVW